MPGGETLTSEALMRRLVALCHERRAEEVAVLDVRDLVDYMDFMVVLSGRSERQNRAIVDHLLQETKREGVLPLSVSGQEAGSWICVDLVDVVVHAFTPETRRHYDLELLWADAPRVDLADLAPPAGSEAELDAEA